MFPPIEQDGKPLGIVARWKKSGEIAQFHRREIGQERIGGAPFGSLASGEFGCRLLGPPDFHPQMKMPLPEGCGSVAWMHRGGAALSEQGSRSIDPPCAHDAMLRHFQIGH
jgi:hypothetical protein